jgi:hypothetical protein
MSDQKSSKKNKSIDIISVEDIILEYVLDCRWKDYKKFAKLLTLKIAATPPASIEELRTLIESFNHPFFDFNEITKDRFVTNFPLKSLLEQCRTQRVYLPKTTNRKVTKRKTISKKIRILVMERDKFKCRICGKTAKETKLEVDHKIPVAKGGKDSLENLWTLCIDCNRGKSDLSLDV